MTAKRRVSAPPISPNEPTDADELAELLKRWRRGGRDRVGHDDIGTEMAAVMLGLPRRTIEGIEQGRGFRYPRLLVLALQAFE